jgi:hypothetical protein
MKPTRGLLAPAFAANVASQPLGGCWPRRPRPQRAAAWRDSAEYSRLTERAARDLPRFATFVRLSLEHLIEHGQSLNPGGCGAGVSFPKFYRPLTDMSQWSPQTPPGGWREAISNEPDDPVYRKPE